jgi:hypothetical protein
MWFVSLQSGGAFESVAGAAVTGGTLVLVLALVALGAFAYKQLRGGGVEWPEDTAENAEDAGAQRGSQDDEWKYY